jgi:hypothetical protein
LPYGASFVKSGAFSQAGEEEAEAITMGREGGQHLFIGGIQATKPSRVPHIGGSLV